MPAWACAAAHRKSLADRGVSWYSSAPAHFVEPVISILRSWRSAPVALPHTPAQTEDFLSAGIAVDGRTPSEPRSDTRRDLRASLIICICCLLVYNANGRAISAGDALPARYLPFAIWEHHTLLLDPVESLVLQGREPRANDSRPQPHPAFWTVTRPNGHLVSLYPVVLPVTIAPLYLPAVTYVHWQGRTDERVDHIARIMEKFSASLMAALSASLLYLLLRRRATPRIALLLTVAYAFGTTTWSRLAFE